MKHLRNIALFAMILTMNASSIGGGNSVYIDQTNADSSSLSITQTGSNNTVGDPTSITSPSFVVDGNSMMVTIIQDGMNNAMIGNIIGGNTIANLTQTGNSNSSVFEMGNMGTSSGILNMTFNGSNNTSLLRMGNLTDSSNYTYTTLVTGDTNSISSIINSKYIADNFLVTGSNNTITTSQSGANGTNLLAGNSIAINNIGSYNNISVVQDGTSDPNSAIVNLTGSSATVSVTQH